MDYTYTTHDKACLTIYRLASKHGYEAKQHVGGGIPEIVQAKDALVMTKILTLGMVDRTKKEDQTFSAYAVITVSPATACDEPDILIRFASELLQAAQFTKELNDADITWTVTPKEP